MMLSPRDEIGTNARYAEGEGVRGKTSAGGGNHGATPLMGLCGWNARSRGESHWK